jgi:DNA-binding CsgD family transcriptional regulator
VALCDASLGDLPAAASDLQRAVALSARVGAYHSGAAAAIGDAAFALTFVRNHGWERLARETDAMIQDPAMAFGMDGANAIITGAVAHAYSGDEARALEALARAIPAIEMGHGRVYGYTRLVCLAVEVHWLLRHRGDHLPLLEQKLRDEIIAPDFRQPSVDARRSLAHICALGGDAAEAARWFSKSRGALDEQGARPLRAIVDFEEAFDLMHRRGDADVSRAEALAGAALATFRKLDMRGWVNRAEALRGEIASARAASPRRDLPDGLTPREAEVLGLIAAGRTNREISDDLTLSVRTVARHITNIYGKIGARGKADATAYAIRHRLQ